MAVAGYFGTRMAEMAERHGGEFVFLSFSICHIFIFESDIILMILFSVIRLTVPWGTAFEVKALKEAVLTHKPKILGVVHAETSTGKFLFLFAYLSF